jgi:hypothetical protein
MQKNQRIITIFISLIFTLFPALSHASLVVEKAVTRPASSSVEIKVMVQQLDTANASVVVASQPKVAACSLPANEFGIQGGVINLHQSADCFRVSVAPLTAAPSVAVASIQTVTTVRVIRSHTITHEGFRSGTNGQTQVPLTPVVPAVMAIVIIALSVIYRPRVQKFSKITFHSLSLSQLQILRC